MARDQQARALMVRGRDSVPDGAVEVPLALQPGARPAVQNRYQFGATALELVAQELGEELMVTVPFTSLVQGNQKQVGASELAQELARPLSIHHSVAKWSCKSPQDRGPEQEPFHLLGDARQNLLRQKVHDIAVASLERFDKGVLVLPILQGERSEVEARRPPFGALEQQPEVVGADVKPHRLVQKVGGFLLREGKLLVADLVHLSPRPQQSKWQRRIGAAREDQVDVLRKMLHEKSHRIMTVVIGHELVVIEHQNQPSV